MTHHQEAWDHVKEHLFGSVCEVATKVPWGFRRDRADIINVDVGEFLLTDSRFDTILLHILSGEGLPEETMTEVIESAKERCIKLVILEHNPDQFPVIPTVDYIPDMLDSPIHENWGRNMLWACTTFAYLELHQLNDKYYSDNINKSYINSRDHGIDTDLLVYTHTSESPIGFELPKGLIYWVIGGGIAYESMNGDNINILIDSVLRQVLLCAHIYEPGWKVDRLFDFSNLTISKWPKRWRVVESNGIKPDAIRHLPLDELDCNASVYVSTVHKSHWKHLIKDNNILEAWTERDEIAWLANRNHG